MPELYRLIVRDKMEHIIQQLQRNLISQINSAQPLPVPDFLNLQETTLEEIATMGFKDFSDKYETMKILFQLRLKLSDTGTILLVGAARRNWYEPTVPADQLQLLGNDWRSFEIGLIKCDTVKKLPPRFSALSETIILTITYLQHLVDQAWCDYIMNLAMLQSRCEEDIRIKLPCWCSDETFKS